VRRRGGDVEAREVVTAAVVVLDGVAGGAVVGAVLAGLSVLAPLWVQTSASGHGTWAGAAEAVDAKPMPKALTVNSGPVTKRIFRFLVCSR
jgi:hypothetical protein